MSQKPLIRSLLETWIFRLGLRWWKVDIRWYKKPKAIKKFFGKRKDETVLARVFADWRYSLVSIHINLPAFEGLDDADTESAVVHELVHALVNEMRAGGIDHEERVVTGLTKAFLWTAEDVKEKIMSTMVDDRRI